MIHHAHKCEINIKINRDLKRSVTYQEINEIQINSVNFFYFLYSLYSPWLK